MKLKWPWMSKKKHNLYMGLKERELKTERESRVREVRALRLQHEHEINEKIEPFVKKFIRFRCYEDPCSFERYALQIGMDTHWVESCLIHGNSQREIEYISEIIGHQVARELEIVLRGRNFERKHI